MSLPSSTLAARLARERVVVIVGQGDDASSQFAQDGQLVDVFLIDALAVRRMVRNGFVGRAVALVRTGRVAQHERRALQ